MLLVLYINKSCLQNHRHDKNAQIIQFLTNLVIIKHIRYECSLLYKCLLAVRAIENSKRYVFHPVNSFEYIILWLKMSQFSNFNSLFLWFLEDFELILYYQLSSIARSCFVLHFLVFLGLSKNA
jgi:hypothetical protein